MYLYCRGGFGLVRVLGPNSFFVAFGIHLFKSQLAEGSGNLYLYGFAIIGTCLMSYASYYLLEKPILHFKERFMKIKTKTSKNG